MSSNFDYRTPEEFWPFYNDKVTVKEVRVMTEEDWLNYDKMLCKGSQN